MSANKFLSIFCVAIIFSSCVSQKNSDIKTVQPKKVITVVAKKEEKENQITSFGTISYKTKHNVSSLVDGSVKTLYAKEGDFVRKGQRLAVLRNVQMETEKEQYENALSSAKAALAVSLSQQREQELSVQSRLLSLQKQELSIQQQQLEYENALQIHENNRELHQLGGITDASFKSEELSLLAQKTAIAIAIKEKDISSLGLTDQDILLAGHQIPSSQLEKDKLLIQLNTQSVQAQVQSAKASVSNAEKSLLSINRMLQELTLRASVDGVIGAQSFEEGEFVAANTAIFTILNTDSVYAVFSIQEKDIFKYPQGTPVKIELPSINKIIATTISDISPFADPQSGNFTVKALLKNSDQAIKPGLFVKSTIQEEKKPVFVVIPETAVIQNKEQNFVYSVKNGFVVIQQVQLDSCENGKAWLAKGLKEGTVVIDKPSPFLKEGEQVVSQ